MSDRKLSTDKLTRLTGDQFQLFQRAMVNAFTHQELRELIRVHFDQDLDAFVQPDSRMNVAFELIGWAERTGNLAYIFQAVSEARPANPDVQALAAALASRAVLPAAGPGAGSAVQQAKLLAQESRLNALLAEYAAVNQQLISNVDAQVGVRLKLRLTTLEDEMAQLERDSRDSRDSRDLDAGQGQR